MQFYNLEYVIGFWILPVIVVVFIIAVRTKKKRLRFLGDWTTLDRMSNFSLKDWRVKALILCFAILFAMFALLRPQWGAEKKVLERKGIDVIFLLDTSLSMLAQDAKPSRIEKAKHEIKSFVAKLKGDRVGLIAFAGSSFLQSPLTLDYSAFFLFLDAVSVGYIPDPGSSLRDAIENALRTFSKGEKKYRALVVLSDGEVHGENLSETVKKVEHEGVRIYALGVGTKEGEPIPLKADRGKVVGYKKDRSGQVVISKLDEGLLTQLAVETGGLYFPVTAAEQEIDLVYRDMQKLGKKEFKKQIATEREDHYQVFLFAAVALLFLELFLTDRRAKVNSAGVSA